MSIVSFPQQTSRLVGGRVDGNAAAYRRSLGSALCSRHCPSGSRREHSRTSFIQSASAGFLPLTAEAEARLRGSARTVGRRRGQVLPTAPASEPPGVGARTGHFAHRTLRPRKISLSTRNNPQGDRTMTQVRRCSRCGKVGPSDDFYRDASKSSGFRSICKLCDLAGSKAYYGRNSRRVIERVKAHQAERGGRGVDLGTRDAPTPAPPSSRKRIQICRGWSQSPSS